MPAAADAYLKDHFGLRQKLITAHRELTKPMLGFGNDTVLVGRNGRMFFLGEETVRQSAGLLVRDERVAEATDMLVRMNDELRARGIRFLVAMPPNGSTIFQDDLPLWAQNPGKRTEYDMLLANLAAKGVTAVDLRPAVKNAGTQGPVFYMHDTHWTFRGALAAYNAIAEADAHPDWRIEPASALGPLTPRKGGDLARMLGVGDAVSEYAEPLTLPYAKNAPEFFNPVGAFTETSEKTGPTILILGDSFTGAFSANRFATREPRGLDEPPGLRFRLERGGEISPRRGLVDAHGTFSGVPAWREAEGLARTRNGLGPGNGPGRAGGADGGGPESRWRARMSLKIARSLLVLGGARSGKSAYAQGLAEAQSRERLYLATAAAGDEEMAARIARHRADRGQGWTTLEEPLEIATALLTHAQAGRVVLVDCLTLWLSNLMLAGRDPGPALAALADAMGRLAGPAILVSNEVGMGIVPDHKLGREFRDWQGRANREIGAACDVGIFVAAGLPLQLKPAATPSVQLG